MFGHGKGHMKYVGFAESKGIKMRETVTFATTRFFSSSYKQWESVYKSNLTLMEAFMKFQEDDEDECEETKYEVNVKFYF